MTKIDEKIEQYLREAKPYGKPQEALYNSIQQMKENGNTGEFELSEIMNKFSDKFHNVHFNKVMSAAKALDKKKLIDFDGVSKINIK